MNKRWLAPASLLFIACGCQVLAGSIGGFAYPVIVVSQEASNPRDSALRQYEQSLRHDPLYSSAAATSRGLFDGAGEVRPQPSFIMTSAQAKAVRLIASEALNPDLTQQISEAAEPSMPPTADPAAADPAYDLSRFGSVDAGDDAIAAATAASADEGSTRNSVNASSSSDLTDAGSILSLYSNGLSIPDIVQYEMAKPWMFIGLLLASGAIALVVGLYRRAMSVTEPPAM